MQPMQFTAWHNVYLLLLVPALALLFTHGFRRRTRALNDFVAPALAEQLEVRPDWRRRWFKALCLLVAVGLLVVTLMQPRWGHGEAEAPRRGRDLVVLLDVSLSMLAEDVSPNRLARAKGALRDLVSAVERHGGHRLGLVLFAGRASVQCPLTLDYRLFLERLEQAGPDLVPRRGTLISDALQQTIRSLGDPDPAYTDLILLSDGEDHESLAVEAARALGARGFTLYTVGIGDPEQGARIPLDNGEGQHAFVEYQGIEVISRMNPRLLREIARAAGGVGFTEPGGIELDKLYTQHIAPKPRRLLDVTTSEVLAHRYYWFVLGALILLGLEMLVAETGRWRT